MVLERSTSSVHCWRYSPVRALEGRTTAERTSNCQAPHAISQFATSGTQQQALAPEWWYSPRPKSPPEVTDNATSRFAHALATSLESAAVALSPKIIAPYSDPLARVPT